MQILIGCAKDMTDSSEWQVPHTTVPLYLQEAKHNAMQMMAYSEEELRDMLKVSVPLAREIKHRYAHFLDEGNELAAILAYDGVVFKHLCRETFTVDNYEYSQQHLWITSFLYGLLRPLDGIKPYRLEGKVVLPENGCNMFGYWKPKLTAAFIASIKADDGILIDLASSEMRSFFDWKRVEKEVAVIKPDFLVTKGGEMKSVSVYAKQCRGAMTSAIIRERITNPETLLHLTPQGFEFVGYGKNERNPVFVLQQ